MEEDLEYWEWIAAQREEDLALEMERDQDQQLIKLLSDELTEAYKKIEELSE